MAKVVPLDAKLGLYMKELVSGISSVGEMVILELSTGMGKLDGLDMKSVSGISSVRGMAILESLDGFDMRELVSAVSSVREVVILISSMENRGLGACACVSGKTREWCWRVPHLARYQPSLAQVPLREMSVQWSH